MDCCWDNYPKNIRSTQLALAIRERTNQVDEDIFPKLFCELGNRIGIPRFIEEPNQLSFPKYSLGPLPNTL